MKLNKSTSHAIRILIDCAKGDGALVKVAELAARLDLTLQNAFKIVHILSRAELLTAVRGRNGGVRLTRPADEIRIGDIVRAMEATEIELDDGGSSDKAASQGVNKVFDSALEAFIDILDQHTLADIAGGKRAARKGPKRGGAALKAPGQRQIQAPISLSRSKR